jgi:DNA gyrase/topoisomerase IV subunit B
MRQKLLSWGDDYTIKDEEERELYLVEGDSAGGRGPGCL